MTAETPSRRGPLAAQSRDEPEPYSFPARIISGVLVGLIFLRRLKDRHFSIGRQMAGESAFDVDQLVAQANVGESSAHHDFVIAAARAVGVEVPRLHSVLLQIFSGRTIFFNRTGRRNVVGSNAVSQYRQYARAE